MNRICFCNGQVHGSIYGIIPNGGFLIVNTFDFDSIFSVGDPRYPPPPGVYKNPVNNGIINYLPIGVGFLPSTVWHFPCKLSLNYPFDRMHPVVLGVCCQLETPRRVERDDIGRWDDFWFCSCSFYVIWNIFLICNTYIYIYTFIYIATLCAYINIRFTQYLGLEPFTTCGLCGNWVILWQKWFLPG